MPLKTTENAGQTMKKGTDISASASLKLGFLEARKYSFISFLFKRREGCIRD